MKNKYIAIIILLLMGGLSSCEYLEYSDADHLTEIEDVFGSPQNCKDFVNSIYSYLPETFDNDFGISGIPRDCAADDAEHVDGGTAVQRMNAGNWSSSVLADDKWSDYYAGIRAANVYLENATGLTFEDRRYSEDFDKDLAQYYILEYEARFLRAFFHFDLATRYGSAPIVTKTLTVDEANTIEYADYDDIIAFVVAECDDIIEKEVELEVEKYVIETIVVDGVETQISRIERVTETVMRGLPEAHTEGRVAETGRATKGAALALKARALLHAASPLNNPTGDKAKWEAAAAAAKDVLDLSLVDGIYGLENYANVVNNRNSRDLIFERRNPETNQFEKDNFPVGYEGGNTGTCPTQNLVDAYQTVNGYDVTLTETGYVSDDPDFDPAQPYANRDPRFYATILYNGATFKQQTVETWTGGWNGPQIPVLGTKTGYYLKKYVREDVNLDPANTNRKEHVWVIFRLADFYLSYAEAMNEAYGPEQDPQGYGLTARDAINAIRLNAGMPVIASGLTTDQFRSIVQRERRVELAFEDHRFGDIRRWQIGTQTQQQIFGCKITKNTDESFSYSKFLVENRQYNTYFDRFPYPFKEASVRGLAGQ